MMTFDEFLVSLREPGSRTALSATSLAEALDLPLKEFAVLAGVHRNTVRAAPTSPKLQSAMRDIVRALSAAYALTGDLDRALFWFRNHPISDLDHLTPMQLVGMGKVDAVVDYIQSLHAGGMG